MEQMLCSPRGKRPYAKVLKSKPFVSRVHWEEGAGWHGAFGSGGSPRF